MILPAMCAGVERGGPAGRAGDGQFRQVSKVTPSYMCATPPNWWCTAPTSEGDILVCCPGGTNFCSCDPSVDDSCKCTV